MPKTIHLPLFAEAILGSVVLSLIAFTIQSNQGFSWADEGLLWYGAQRVFSGEIPIRDFYSYDPGRYYWISLFFWLLSDTGLHTVLLAGTCFGGLALAISWYTTGAAKLDQRWRFTFATAVIFALGYPRHKIYEQSLSLILVSLIYLVLSKPESTRRWFTFGVSTGLAAILGRNHGVFYVAAAALCGFWLLATAQRIRIPRTAASYSAGVFVGYLPLLLTCTIDAGFREAFWRSILFVPNWQLPLSVPFFWRIDYGTLPLTTAIHEFLIGVLCLGIPLMYVASLAFLWWRNQTSNNPMLPGMRLLAAFCIAGIPYLHQAFDRADFGHIAQGIVPAFGAIVSLGALNIRNKVMGHIKLIASMFLIATMVLAWFPHQPWIRMNSMESRSPGSTTSTGLSGQRFKIETYQTTLLKKVDHIKMACKLRDSEFMAAPHFPGLYAYLGLKSPFWEVYYLYSRSSEMQNRHIQAMDSVKVILLIPDATIDELEHLKFRNTYSKLYRHIVENFEKKELKNFPEQGSIYFRPGACDVRLLTR